MSDDDLYDRLLDRMQFEDMLAYLADPDMNDTDSEESSDDDTVYHQRFEVFVGNLPEDIDEYSLEDEINEMLYYGRKTRVQRIVHPQRGPPFAFVRCNNEDAYRQLFRVDLVRNQ